MRLADHFFYSDAREGEVFLFDAEEARHATRTLRLRPGDGLRWVDGVGGRYGGTLVSSDRAGMHVRAETVDVEPRPAPRELLVGVPHDATRLEWLVEKSVELGATRITLVRSGRVERTRHRMPRLRAKALAAMKQSGRAYLPEIRELDFDEVRDRPDASLRIVAHCHTDRPRATLLDLLRERGGEPSSLEGGVALLIGPEGDFTADEIAAAAAAGWLEATPGASRLRTETAALAALAVVGAAALDHG